MFLATILADRPLFLIFQSLPSMEQSPPSVRTKAPTACDVCRRRKLRCDGQTPSCSNCTLYKVPCNYAKTRNKPGPRKGWKRKQREDDSRQEDASKSSKRPSQAADSPPATQGTSAHDSSAGRSDVAVESSRRLPVQNLNASPSISSHNPPTGSTRQRPSVPTTTIASIDPSTASPFSATWTEISSHQGMLISTNHTACIPFERF